MFILSCTSDRIWNQVDLIRYLVRNQHGSIQIKVNPEAICLHNLGFYKILDCFEFEKVEIFTANPFETHARYLIKAQGVDMWFRLAKPIQPDMHTWNTSKVFLCLFGRPTAGRLGLAAHLYDNHQLISHVHFSTGTHCDELQQFELDKLLSFDIALIEPTGSLIKKMPLLLGDRSGYTAYNGFDYADPLALLYRDIFVDVVVESHVAGRTFFPTEKTIRSILMKKPFIIYASQNFLDYLHQMGFKTFCEFWSENYDGFDTKERLQKIIILLDELSGKSTYELQSMYKAMQKILDHNYDLLINRRYRADLTLIE